MNILYKGVRSKLQNLPLLGADVLADEYLETMVSEVKRIETPKLSFQESPYT